MNLFKKLIQIILYIGLCAFIICNSLYNLEVTKPVIEIIGIVSVTFIAIFIFRDFSPKVALRIIPNWESKENGVLKIRTEIENVSRVVCWKKSIRFQLLEQNMTGNMINEVVAFEESYIEYMDPVPVKFYEAEEINKSTLYLYPKEIILTERLYKVNPQFVQHIGLQFEAKLGFMKYILWLFDRDEERWTTTIIVTEGSNLS